MRQRSGVLLPIDAIELVDGDIQVHPIVETAPGYGEAILVRTRHIKALHTARLAKAMFRAACIERVFRQIVGAAQQSESRRRHDDVDIAAHRADRTVTVFDPERGGKVDFKPNGFAMTAARVCVEFNHGRSNPSYQNKT